MACLSQKVHVLREAGGPTAWHLHRHCGKQDVFRGTLFWSAAGGEAQVACGTNQSAPWACISLVSDAGVDAPSDFVKASEPVSEFRYLQETAAEERIRWACARRPPRCKALGSQASMS